MRKLLPTIDVSKDVLRRLMNLSLLIFTFVTLSFDTSFGQTFGQVECDCLGNGSTDQNGQFGERIIISSEPGETWSLVSATGLFDPASAAPPAQPTPFGGMEAFSYIGGGNYILEGIRQPGTMWTVVVTNGVQNFTRSSLHVCNNPESAIVGDFGSCESFEETYTIPAANPRNITWTVTGGTIVSGQGSSDLTVDWDVPEGDYEISYTAQAPSFASQTNGLCDISDTQTVSIMDEEAFPLACNNSVNVTLAGNCSLEITADMLLEDMMFTNASYDLVLTDMSMDTIIPSPMIGMEYINSTIQVSVVHECSGNSCWGVVKLEDKSIPPLACPVDATIDCDQLMTPELTGFPLPPSAVITQIDDTNYLVEGFDFCSDVNLTYQDEVVSSNLCDGPFSSIVERTFVATDESGNESTCSFLINVNRATLADLTFPDNFDDVLGPNPSLMACGSFQRLPNGAPDPSVTGEPEGTFCLNVFVDYEDIVLPKCGDQAIKVLRRWMVSDLCSAESREQTQTITIMDNEDPTCDAPTPYTVGTSEGDCSSIIDVIPPTITDCSSTTYTVSYKAVVPGEDPFFQPSNEGVVENNDGTFTITQLPTNNGQVYILYYVRDACGNTSQCFTTITVIDDQQPIPVCDLNTFIAVGEDGEAYANVAAFDDGSWDNCSIAAIEIRRMNNSPCGVSNPWTDRIKFCCADIGAPVMIQLRVTDSAGNSNICMVEAQIQDNSDPVFTSCPPNRTLDCDADLTNLSQYGSATASDNCNVTITETSSESINGCREGVVIRTFTATDDFGNSVTCQQRLTITNLDPFYVNPFNPNDPNDDIIWPGNVNIANGCAGDDILPDNLPSGRQRPIILNEGCSDVSFSSRDVFFQYVDGSCLKVLRTWTVIDHCRFTSPFSTEGIFTYVQTIEIQNSNTPTFVSGCRASDVAVTQLASCRARLEASATAEDDCTEDASLIYSYKVDYGNNGSIDSEGPGRILNEVVDFGTHRIIWVVEDQCGNIETCDFTVTVADNKAPTPYCRSEVVTVIMAETGEVEIWASDFNQGSFDNCSSDDELVASFSPNINDTRLLIRCEDLTSSPQEFELEVYITDPSGNSDFCTTSLIIQDNQGVCGDLEDEDDDDDDDDDDTEETRVELGGHIYNDQDEMLENVKIQLDANLSEFPIIDNTDSEGGYIFKNLPGSENYVIKPQSDDNYRDGVNTLDLVKIQRHILGLEVLESPYKIIASDINNDERLTAADLLTLRKLILGVTEDFPKNSSWRFIDASYEFVDVTDPFPFEEDLLILEAVDDFMQADFVAVKVGDVDGSASGYKPDSEKIETRSTKAITTEEQLLAVGYNEIGFSAKDLDGLYGLQVVLAINQRLVSDISVSSTTLGISDDNYRYQDGKLYISASQAIANTVDGEIFTVKVTTKDEAYVSDILSMDREFMVSQLIVTSDAGPVAEQFDLEVKNRSGDVEHDFELYQNVPNPFGSSTDIAFVLPSDQRVTLNVMDITGKLVYSTSNYFRKGYNVITLDIAHFQTSGIMHYQLATETDSDSRKMIIIK